MKRQAFLIAAAAAALLVTPGLALAQSADAEQSGKPNRPPPPPPPPSNNNAAWALIGWTEEVAALGYYGSGVTVGLFDGLTYCPHAELGPAAPVNAPLGGFNCANHTFSPATYRYYDHHGTHTAGTIAGATVGIARNARITNYAVFDDRKYVATGDKLINAWNSAVGEGARIASMSFGCTGLALCFSTAEINAMGTTNLLFVKAAGNDNRNLANETSGLSQGQVNAALSQLIMVGSVNNSGVISSFSNRPGDGCLLSLGQTSCAGNYWRDRFIVAPGENIYSSMASTTNPYGHMSGTSMATPVVAGTAALIMGKWPATTPAQAAAILFSTALDKGVAGIDNVYGHGLLQVGAAMNSVGPTSIASSSGGSGDELPVDGLSMTLSSTFGEKFKSAIGGVSAYDSFGRDFPLSEVSSFSARRSPWTHWATPGSRLATMGSQDDWTAGFFAPVTTTTSYASFGPAGSTAAAGLSFDTSLRMGVDLPLERGALNLRMTGSSDTRADFAGDAALRPLSFFASSELMNESAFVGFSRNLSQDSRLIMFATGSAGTQVNPEAIAPLSGQDGGFHQMLGETAFGVDQSVRRQAGVGLSYWRQLDDRTVAGLNVSAMAQRHAFYDLASDLGIFDKPTLVVNLGAAASRTYGAWDLFASGEVSQLSGTADPGPLAFTGATLASGEVGVRRSNLFFNGGTQDALTFSLTQAPTAVAGALALDYLERTDDGLGRQSVNRAIPLSELTRQPLRLETAYSVKSGAKWSLGVGAGVSVEDQSDVIATTHFQRRF